MDIFERLRMPDVCLLEERYHELYGYWGGYHWEVFGSVEEYKEWLEREISKKEKEFSDDKDHP